MIFTMQNNYEPCNLKVTTALKNEARFRLIAYKLNIFEKELDAFLKKQYNKTLKQVCNEIIEVCVLSNYDGSNKYNILVTIPNQQLNKLATVITYGSLSVKGSKILKKIFMREEIIYGN